MALRVDSLSVGMLAVGAVAFFALFLLTLPLPFVDRRALDAESVWAKPLKFDLALGLHFATLAIIVSLLSEGWHNSVVVLVTAIVAEICAVFEIVYIYVQAGRGQRSHFNLGSPFLKAMYGSMAIGAFFITIAAAIIGVAVAFDTQARLSIALRVACMLGLVGGAYWTLKVAFTMGGRLTHHVGSEAAGASRVPLAGWSKTVGDFRPAHFAATHMMQVIPLFGLLAGSALPALAGLIAVVSVAAIWIFVIETLFARALAGKAAF